MRELKPYPEYKDSGVEWLGQLPVDWDICAVGRFVRFRNGADYASVEVEEGGYPVYGSGGEFRRASSYLFEGESVLFGRKGTIDKPLHVDGRFWTVDTMYYTDISTNHLLPRFVYYWATQLPYAYWVTSTALPSMTQSDLATAKIPYTSLTDQAAIVKFLDRETTETDTFIADQVELIRLLTERRAATITHAVTKGFDTTAQMKWSGVEWVGDIPEHWSISTVRTLVDHINVRNDPIQSDNYLSLMANVGVLLYADKGDVGNKAPEDFTRCKIVKAGDLVINSMNYGIGSFGVSPYDGICSPVYVVLRPAVGHGTSAFIARLFESRPFQRLAQSFGNGILEHRRAISWDTLKNLPIPLPPLDEQQDIADQIDVEIAELEGAIVDARQSIVLSRERRAALISAAVTGKIDVREHAHSGVA